MSLNIYYIEVVMTWFIAGPLIDIPMGLLFFYGKTFGVSSNLQTVCKVMEEGKKFEYFNWKG